MIGFCGIHGFRSPGDGHVTHITPQSIKTAIIDAGFEIYRATGGQIRLAERVRLHLMDSGITVDVAEDATVSFTVRSQRSDFPMASAEDLYAKVRDSMKESVAARGFVEVGAVTREVTDPVDENNVLDVWHELTYSKTARDVQMLIDDVRWALGVPKCVTG